MINLRGSRPNLLESYHVPHHNGGLAQMVAF